MKVFISFATEDRSTAEAVYDDVAATGADVFQYGRSETAGKPTWEEILAWIKQSDAFVLLVSRHAVKSPAVREELNCAYYSYINTDATKPAKIIPAIIEAGTQPPALIEHFGRLQLTALDVMLPRLLSQLGLQKRALAKSSPPLFTALPDPSELFEQYLRKNPTPSTASLWSEKAEKISTNYRRLKPPGIGSSIATPHLTHLLREQLGKPGETPDANPIAKFDGLFLGLSKDTITSETTPPRTLSDLLLSYDWSTSLAKLPLATPQLTVSILGLSWEPVTGAAAYAVERSADQTFSSPAEIYRGTNTRCPTKIELGKTPPYYRVKAVGGVFRRDSPWSEGVQDGSNLWMLGRKSGSLLNWTTKLSTPHLRQKPWLGGTRLEWDAVSGASRYVVERSADGFFGGSITSIYDGEGTSYADSGEQFPSIDFLLKPATALPPPDPFKGMFDKPKALSYRVKAMAGPMQAADSDWSNIVTMPSNSKPARRKR